MKQLGLARIQETDETSERLIVMLESALGASLPLLNDPEVLELARNDDGTLWVNRLGKGWSESEVTISDSDAQRLIYYAAGYKNAVCDEKRSIVSCVLPFNGSRFQGIVPPVAQRPTFTIRKKALMVFTLDDYIRQGVLTPERRDLIVNAVKGRMNILVVGGTNTGKTTFCNAILEEIAKTGHRVVTLEDTEELQCKAKNRVQMIGNDYTSMRDLLKATMRLSPDRIIIGEVRDGAALDLLKAWNTGHPGGCATVHANSAAEGLDRLEQLILEVSDDPQCKLIGKAVNLVVFLELVENKRLVREIVRVHGYKNGEYAIEAC